MKKGDRSQRAEGGNCEVVAEAPYGTGAMRNIQYYAGVKLRSK